MENGVLLIRCKCTRKFISSYANDKMVLIKDASLNHKFLLPRPWTLLVQSAERQLVVKRNESRLWMAQPVFGLL